MPGAERLAENLRLDALLKRQKEEKKLIAAMCAAPAVVLLGKNLLEEASEATAHPAFDLGEAFAKDKKKRVCYSKASNGRVVITSQGPGTAIEFALELVKELCGEEKRKEVAGPMCVPEDVLMG
jgi:4-methyl-5(b-hydroxyethyl)-thiazole monophosphate biosynthesis